MGKADAAASLLTVAVVAYRDATAALGKGHVQPALQAIASALRVLDAPRDLQVVTFGTLCWSSQLLTHAAATDIHHKNLEQPRPPPSLGCCC